MTDNTIKAIIEMLSFLVNDVLKRFSEILEVAEISKEDFYSYMEKIATQTNLPPCGNGFYGNPGKLYFLAGGVVENVTGNLFHILGLRLRGNRAGSDKLAPIVLAEAMRIDKRFDCFIRSIYKGADVANPHGNWSILIREIDHYSSKE